jgi:hypothetical protein
MNDEGEAHEFVAGRKGTSEFPRRRYPQAACSDLGPLFAFVLMVSRPLAKPFCRAGARCALFASRPSNILDEQVYSPRRERMDCLDRPLGQVHSGA